MRIAVVGAGALGCIYALKLSHVAPVVLVVRDVARAPKHVVAERANNNGPTMEGAPPVVTAVPDDVDAVLVAVRVDQLDDALLRSLARGGPPHRIVVVLTPLLPAVYDRVVTTLGDRLVVAISGVVAYEPDHDPGAQPDPRRRIRYWTPKASPTQLDARAPDDPSAPIIADLAQTLVAAGLPAEVKPAVRTINPATTIAFFPLLLGIQAAGGSIDRLLGDGALLRLSLDAAKETRALAKTVGELAGFASLLLSFAGPFTIRAGLKLVRGRAPESLVFLEKHFGGKLAAQNGVMLEAIETLARERGRKLDALRALATKAGLSHSPSA